LVERVLEVAEEAPSSVLRSVPWRQFAEMVDQVVGVPRHLSIHVGGMLVTGEPLWDIAPLEKASMDGRVVVQFDKDDVEDLGLIKIDLLGLRTLSVVEEALSELERVEGGRPDLEGLDPPSRQAVETALWLRYFMPTVVRITAVAEESPGQNGAVVWELDTDRGYMRLRMANLFEGIEQLPSGRIVLSDRDGNRAHIPDAAGLDPQSRRLLERYYWF
jgi:hypothetical protein